MTYPVMMRPETSIRIQFKCQREQVRQLAAFLQVFKFKQWGKKNPPSKKSHSLSYKDSSIDGHELPCCAFSVPAPTIIAEQPANTF